MRPLPVLAATATVACLLAPAAQASHRKPLTGSYDLTLPVPFPAENATGSHCADAPDGLSKDSRVLTLPAAGKLKVALSKYTGDWVAELNDPKGRLVASAAGLNTADNGMALSFKKKSVKSEKYTLSVCNYLGAPKGHVDWVFTFDK